MHGVENSQLKHYCNVFHYMQDWTSKLKERNLELQKTLDEKSKVNTNTYVLQQGDSFLRRLNDDKANYSGTSL